VAAQQFNVRNAVRFFGGPAELVRRAKSNDMEITVKAVEKWQERGQIPGIWLVRLSQLARSEGRNFDIHDFISSAAARGENSGQ
jgi:hypothetical protein